MHRLSRRRETPLELAERIADAYGLVLALIMATFIIMMTLPPEGWGGRVAAIAAAVSTSIVAFTSSNVGRSRVLLATVIAAAAVLAAALAKALDSDHLLGAAFVVSSTLLAIAAVVILRRVVRAIEVDFRTILGAVSVFALLGLLFAFFYLGFSRVDHSDFFTGVRSSAVERFPFLQLHDPDDHRLRKSRPGRRGRPVSRRARDAARPVFPRHARRRAGEPLAARAPSGDGELSIERAGASTH